MEKRTNTGHIIKNSKEILGEIEKNFKIEFPNSILDFQYYIITHVFGFRFFRSKAVISESIDNNELTVIDKDKITDGMASIDIMDLNSFLEIN
ncbi:MAG: hypothetical protein ACTSO9_10825 [Candidatus Helarchaeota archaeon]